MIEKRQIDEVEKGSLKKLQKIEVLIMIQEELAELFEEDKLTEEEYNELDEHTLETAKKILKSN